MDEKTERKLGILEIVQRVGEANVKVQFLTDRRCFSKARVHKFSKKQGDEKKNVKAVLDAAWKHRNAVVSSNLVNLEHDRDRRNPSDHGRAGRDSEATRQDDGDNAARPVAHVHIDGSAQHEAADEGLQGAGAGADGHGEAKSQVIRRRGGRRLNLAGQRFGKLIAISPCRAGRDAGWLCQCDCGKTAPVSTTKLTSAHTQSCGCLVGEKIIARCTTHGLAKSPTHHSWRLMLERCEKPQCESFSKYGGRGIKVCKRWHSFTNFVADMGVRPSGMTIDRIDSDGNYEPQNCRWATPKQQAGNTRRARLIEAFGERKHLTDWQADPRCRVGYGTLKNRIRILGWKAEDAISTPQLKTWNPHHARPNG